MMDDENDVVQDVGNWSEPPPIDQSLLDYRIHVSFTCLVSIIVIFANGVVLYVIRVTSSLHGHRFVASLAVVDLASGFVGPLVNLAIVGHIRSYDYCRVVLTVGLVLCPLSMQHNFHISLHRWIVLSRPLHHNLICTRTRAIAIIVFHWVIAFVVTFVIVFFFQSPRDPSVYNDSPCRLVNFIDYTTFLVAMTITFVAPMLGTFIMYFKIFLIARKQRRKTITLGECHSKISRMSKPTDLRKSRGSDKICQASNACGKSSSHANHNFQDLHQVGTTVSAPLGRRGNSECVATSVEDDTGVEVLNVKHFEEKDNSTHGVITKDGKRSYPSGSSSTHLKIVVDELKDNGDMIRQLKSQDNGVEKNYLSDMSNNVKNVDIVVVTAIEVGDGDHSNPEIKLPSKTEFASRNNSHSCLATDVRESSTTPKVDKLHAAKSPFPNKATKLPKVKSPSLKSSLRAARLMGTLCSYFILSWAPFITVIFLDYHHVTFTGQQHVYVATWYISYLVCLGNPLLFMFALPEVKRTVKKMLFRCGKIREYFS